MASKKNLLRKRKQDFTRRNQKIKLIQLDNYGVTFNKKREIVYNGLINFKKESNTILNVKEDLDFLLNEYNTKKDKLTKEEKNEIIKDINTNIKVIRNIKQIQIKVKNTPNFTSNGNSNNVNEDDEIIAMRLKGKSGIFNTFNIDNEVRKIANLLNISFEECLELIFPHFEENSNYEDMIKRNREITITFEEYVTNLKNKNIIDEETFDNVMLCFYNIQNL